MIKYLFVDGNALRNHVKQFAERYAPGHELSLDWQLVKGSYDKAFYYDAIPVRNADEDEKAYRERIEQISKLHESLEDIDGFRVYEGDARKRSGRGLEQKKVDVMITVDMLVHTIRGNMNRAGLIAGDLDFKPLLDALVSEGMFVTLLYPPRSTSRELRAAADSRLPLLPRTTYGWLDKRSRELVGEIPTPSIRGGKATQNCVKITSVPADVEEIEIWHELTEDKVLVTVLHAEPDTYLHIAGCRWEMTRKFAEDEFGLQMPNSLPEEFAHL